MSRTLLSIVVPIEPVPKGRPRALCPNHAATLKWAHNYSQGFKLKQPQPQLITPAKTRTYEMVLRKYFCMKWGNRAPYEGLVAVQAAFFMPRPQSLPKRAPPGPFIYRGRGDVDNMLKSCLDALQPKKLSNEEKAWFARTDKVNPGVLHDDVQVVDITAWKGVHGLGEEPRIAVKVIALDDPLNPGTPPDLFPVA